MNIIPPPSLFERHSGVYAIRHNNTGRVYVGSAVDFRDRWRRHRQELHKGTHCNRYLQSSWMKHGSEAFTFLILEFVDDPTHLIETEQRWMDHLKSQSHACGFNIAPRAGSTLGLKFSDEAKKHNITRQQGQRSWKALFTDEQVLQIKKQMLAGEGNTAIAKRLGVKVATITAIRVGRSWKHIELPGSPNLRCTWPMIGGNHPRAKLTDEIVKEIKHQVRCGRAAKEIQSDFKISRHVYWSIVSGKCWGHI